MEDNREREVWWLDLELFRNFHEKAGDEKRKFYLGANKNENFSRFILLTLT